MRLRGSKRDSNSSRWYDGIESGWWMETDNGQLQLRSRLQGGESGDLRVVNMCNAEINAAKNERRTGRLESFLHKGRPVWRRRRQISWPSRERWCRRR